MLTKQAPQLETIWDGLFPDFVRILPPDLARLDRVLDAPQVLKKFETHWGRAKLQAGRPSMPMATYLRLMALKHGNNWGYERLVRQVADSFHLRRFCRISIVAEVPDESTIRKLTRRLGPELVDDLIREVVELEGAWIAAEGQLPQPFGTLGANHRLAPSSSCPHRGRPCSPATPIEADQTPSRALLAALRECAAGPPRRKPIASTSV